MILENYPEIKALAPEIKLALVTEIWDDLEEHPATVPVQEDLIEEINRRLDHFRSNPDQFTTWEAVKAELKASKQ